jgi:hypothetical protein
MERLQVVRKGALVISKLHPDDIEVEKKEIYYKGFIFKANVREMVLQDIGSIRFPVMFLRPNKRFKRLTRRLFRRKNESFPGILEFPIAFMTNLPRIEDDNTAKFGSPKEFYQAINELRISNTNGDFKRIANKYDFPENFLKEAFIRYQHYKRDDIQVEKKKELLEIFEHFLDKASDEYKNLHFGIAETKIDEIGLVLFDFFNSENKKWLPVFQYWNSVAYRESRISIQFLKKARTQGILLGILIMAASLLIWLITASGQDLAAVLVPIMLATVFTGIIELVIRIYRTINNPP